MNERGKVDIAYAEELTGKDYDTVIAELGQSVFRNPMEVNPEDKYSGFELAEKYLSGNVSRKLVEAKEAVRKYPELGYAGNVEALEEVQPVPLTASEISVRVGASWVDKKYYLEFLSELLNIPYYYARRTTNRRKNRVIAQVIYLTWAFIFAIISIWLVGGVKIGDSLFVLQRQKRQRLNSKYLFVNGIAGFISER